MCLQKLLKTAFHLNFSSVRCRIARSMTIRTPVREMHSTQELVSLVFAFTIAMVILHVFCYLMEKIRNIAANVMERVWRVENQMQQVAGPAVQRRPVAVEHEWFG